MNYSRLRNSLGATTPGKSIEVDGINITYNDEGEAIMKEYLPDGPPKGNALQAVLNATPEELIEIKRILGII